MPDVDVATLGLAVDYSPIDRAAASLAAFRGSAGAAEGATLTLAEATAQLSQRQQEAFAHALETTGGNVELAAKLSGVTLNYQANTSAVEENDLAVTKLFASLSPLIAAEQLQSNTLLQAQKLHEADALSITGLARAHELAGAKFDATSSKIEGTVQWLAKLKAAQDAQTVQHDIADAFGIGGNPKSAAASAGVFVEAQNADAAAAGRAMVAYELEREELGRLGAEAQIAADKLFQLKLAQAGGNFQSDLNTRLGIGAPSAKSQGATESAASSAFNTLPKDAEEAGSKVEKLGGQLKVTRMEMVNLGMAAKDIASGNIGMAGANAGIAAIRFGALGSAMLPVTAAVAAITIATVGLVYEMEQGSEQSNKLTNSLILTGQYANITAGQFNTMAQSLSSRFNQPIGQSIASLQSLVSTGQLTGQSLVLAGQDAAMFANLTGQSSDKAVAYIEKVKDGAAKFAEEWEKNYSGINASELAHIELLEKEGDKAGATQEALQDLYNSEAKEAPAALGIVEQAWRNLTNQISAAVQAVRDFGKDDAQTKVYQDKQSIWMLQNRQGVGGDDPIDDMFGGAAHDKSLKNAQDKLALDQQVLDGVNTMNAATGAQTQKERDQAAALGVVSDHYVNIKNNAGNAAAEVKIFNDAFEKLPKDAQLAKIQQLAPGFAGDTKAFESAEDTQISRRYDAVAFKKPKAGREDNADKFDDQTANINNNAAALLAEASAYDQDSLSGLKAKAAADAYSAAIKESQGVHGQLPTQSAQAAREQANYNLAIDKTLSDDSKYISGIQQKTDAQNKLNAIVQAGSISYEEASKQVESITKLDLLHEIALHGTAAQAIQATDEIETLTRALKAQSDADTGLAIDKFADTLQGQSGKREKPTFDIYEAGSNSQAQSAITAQLAIVAGQYKLNAISVDQYNAELGKLQQTQLELNVATKGSWSDIMAASLHSLVATGKTTSQQLTETFSSFFSTMEDGFANSIGKAITQGGDLKTSLTDAARTGVGDLISGLVKMGEQWAINAALGDTLQAASTAANVTSLTAINAIAVPTATAVSIATFGAADIAATTAMGATFAAGLIFGTPKAAGGWVRGGGGATEDNILTPTSSGEFVTKADVAQDPINAYILEQMNAGRKFSSGRAAGGYVGNGPTQSVGSSAGGAGVTVIHDFTNAHFNGSVTKEDVASILDESMRQVYGPALVRSSVQTSLVANNKLNQRQRMNPNTSNRNF